MNKNKKIFFLSMALFFVTTLLLLGVDRQCAMISMYGDSVSERISERVQVFIENITDLH